MGSSHSSPTATALSSSVRDSVASSLDESQSQLDTPSSRVSLSQQHEPYAPPSSPIHPMAHYIFLVHGWLGNDLEMSYLSESFVRCIASETKEASGDRHERHHDAIRVKRSPSQSTQTEEALSFWADRKEHPPIVVHSVKCNVGKTHDGIKNGGTRLAHEIVDFIRTDLQKLRLNLDRTKISRSLEHDETSSTNAREEQPMQEGHVTYSIVGNSLGGLYARYAVSLVPRQLSLPTTIPNDSFTDTHTTHHHHHPRVHLHPNTFCTTATPHLGVSRHTFLPIPRFAETIIGSGLGTTGKDLFRLNSDRDGRENVIGASVRKWSGSEGVLGSSWKSNGDGLERNESNRNGEGEEQVDEEMECIIRNMCLQEKYLGPLRHFRKRIAYANAYRTDFQVPTETAAFLNAESDVKHTVIAARDVVATTASNVEEKKHERDESSSGGVAVPPFIVAVVRTEQKPHHSQQQQQQQQQPQQSLESASSSDELLKMSQSLDALGWTKVFIDVRNRIPLPGIPKPSWRLLPFPSALSTMLPQPDTSLDDLIHRRGFNHGGHLPSNSSSLEEEPSVTGDNVTTVTSSELIQSTNAGQTVHFPMGHTVMVANSKSETYSKLNFQGRPVMDKLAEDMLRDVLEFE